MQAIGLRPKVHVSADGSGVVGHAGARLLADLADATGLTAAYSAALRPLRPRGTGHDPGRVATDLAVMLADGGEAIADLAVLRDQGEVFGPVASTPTAWRLLADTDEAALASLRAARASAREVAWMQAAETGEGIPAARAGGRELPGLVLDLDATLVTCHSEKEQAAPTYKGGFGFHPLLCFLANTGEAVSGRLRPGNSGANTASDHITVLDQALAQIPDAHRHGTDILVRADSAGSAKAFLAHIRDVRKRGIRTFFSVGYAITEPVRRAVRALPDRLWHPALDQDGTLRDGAEVAELTDMVDLTGYPVGTRIIVRRERPHPGAQLSLFDLDEGLRHQVFLTDTPYSGGGSAQFLEVRHRGHACVEDHIRCGKTTGFGRFPSRDFAINTVWLELSLTAIDLMAWTRVLLLDGELATAEPKKLRYRLLHVAARLTRGGRRLRLRISATWPWRHELATAFHRLAALPRPAD
ncbi:thioesterase domain-containing protein [Streptomyces sp. V4I23]|uniref:IS1380 family transposase n=1 Tax=Streptomyces sp. V4I23 TaxID=3042282 RepID=UPI002784DBA3|nr:IS1380 family transposase [Streptomyces sp. V4I23]MDQ1005543.1 thioesterase domain-containing protein [Streptomyces sp. V4I23]MDQ1005619.1 thioesterase domain-containing protein [Streptomyces sp. V4I23]MDQ1005626.1 thioesterase domain-containing protein [Streptomyces sp. V4I23]MDQ1005656.1 thioesterase domain-containing protein [Streptomyces sp. V4I23]MDQ1005658.1 thioesterase domain-containing protein [Streptomyces sp. V4I23]